MTPEHFIATWENTALNEEQGAQSWFNDLCELIGHEKPRGELNGLVYAFEHRIETGKADAYYENHFGWEFKAHEGQLDEAMRQVLGYSMYLKTPPLLVVSAFNVIRIRTNFPGMESVQHTVRISELAEPQSPPLNILKRVFTDPASFNTGKSRDDVTKETAALFQAVSNDMARSGYGADPSKIRELAQYLNQIIFCLYAEDAGLLPDGAFTGLVVNQRRDPERFRRGAQTLFAEMNHGGLFGPDTIEHFNGELFAHVPDVTLNTAALERLAEAAAQNWSNIEPSIFGTLFERALGLTEERAPLGAHYTSEADIRRVVEPVVMAPLRREWAAARAEIEELSEAGFTGFDGLSGLRSGQSHHPRHSGESRNPVTENDNGFPNSFNLQPLDSGFRRSDDCVSYGAIDLELGALDGEVLPNPVHPINPENPASDDSPARQRLESFRRRLASVTVLDPACGSGNFLYVALRSLLDLEREALDYAAARGFRLWQMTPTVQPDQMMGLEINEYAAQLAKTALWIGYIQWHQANGFAYTNRPILDNIDGIERRDAAIAVNGNGAAEKAQWPAADYIVGNPPFLGASNMLTELGGDYTGRLRQTYRNELDGAVDLCCYWFEQARAQIAEGRAQRAGLLATQAIRFSSNRRTLERIKETGDIFAAYDDLEWKPEEPGSAAVHVSIVCFDDGSETTKTLNGVPASDIDTRLTDAVNLDRARLLPQNAGICFKGPDKGGPFDLTPQDAATMLGDSNPNGRPNSDVVKRYIIGRDLNGKPQERWLVDFGAIPELDAQLYSLPYQHCLQVVKPARAKNRDKRLRERWWQHRRSGDDVKGAIAPLTRYIVTCQVSKHRCFQYIDADTIPDSTIVAFCREDDYLLGILESSIHKVWAAAIGTQLREKESGRRYIISECFEKFPFPTPTESQRQAVAQAARRLDEQRRNVCRPNDSYRRSMTALYNENPPWLRTAHAELDAAAADAYGWPADLTDHELLQRLVRLNVSGGAGTP